VCEAKLTCFDITIKMIEKQEKTWFETMEENGANIIIKIFRFNSKATRCNNNNKKKVLI